MVWLIPAYGSDERYDLFSFIVRLLYKPNQGVFMNENSFGIIDLQLPARYS